MVAAPGPGCLSMLGRAGKPAGAVDGGDLADRWTTLISRKSCGFPLHRHADRSQAPRRDQFAEASGPARVRRSGEAPAPEDPGVPTAVAWDLADCQGIPGPGGKVSRERRCLGCPRALPTAVRPHRHAHYSREFLSNNVVWLESPVTESNRRPSPYHACRFRLMPSRWVGLPQVRAVPRFVYVALRRPLPEGVVT